jgi:hypothetical protein
MENCHRNLDLVDLLIPELPNVITIEKTPQHTSVLTGKLYCEDELSTDNDNRDLEVSRMERNTFHLLTDILCQFGGLKDIKLLASDEKIMILIHILKGIVHLLEYVF